MIENNFSNLKIKDVFIEEEMKDAYLSYAMSVIIGRALPNVYDGLKPVHRRILYAMYKEGLFPNKKYSKSAGVVGEVLKKYHPHGDTSVYDALVRLAQDWSMRYTLVDGQGNFGSIDGDGAAAMRYTESKMEKITERFLDDIEKNTVDMSQNYDETTLEPDVLPSKIPNLLVNGSSGIAVGMATSIPPHNLGEVIDSIVYVIDNPNSSIEDVVNQNLIKAPDFPTKGLIISNEEIKRLYLTGEGSITMKGVLRSEEIGRREAVIIDEIPYQINKVNLINQIVDLVKQGKIKDISDIRDESNKKGIRVVIELKRDIDPNLIINQLYQYSSLKTNFSARILAIVDGVPKILNLLGYIDLFIKFRKNILIRKSEFELSKYEERLHILEGLKKALENIDEIISLIKKAENGSDAKQKLIQNYSFSEVQAQSILDMRLQKLTGLEIQKLIEEYEITQKEIENLKDILSNEKRQYKIIKDDMIEMKEKYGDERQSKLVLDDSNIKIEDLIKDENFVVMLTQNDYIKKVGLDSYRSQKRGGKGVNAHIKDEDEISSLFVANSKDTLLIFTNDGNLNWLKIYEIPNITAQSKGRPVVNYIDLKGRKITNIINVSNLEKGHLIFLTKKGVIKKTEMANFKKPRQGGIKAINLDEGDTVLSVKYSFDSNEDIICQSNVGLAIRFSQSDLAILGRSARGVKAMNLRQNEEVVGIELAKPNKTLLSICENGFGKRTLLSEYPTIKRAGRGVIDIKCDNRNGAVVGMRAVEENDEILIVSKKGKAIRTRVSDISIIGRNTKGVKIVNLESDDKIERFEIITNEDEKENEI